jgi:phospholipid N-methyltransferase
MTTCTRLLEALLPRWWDALPPELQPELDDFVEHHRQQIEDELCVVADNLTDEGRRQAREQVEPPTPLAPAYTLQEHMAFRKRLRTGAVSLGEYKATFERLREHEDTIRQWAMRQPMSALRGLFRHVKASSKAELVDKVIGGMARGFELPKSGFVDLMALARAGRDKRPELEKMAEIVAATTQADLDRVAEEHARSRAQEEMWEAERAARLARAHAPVTLADFEIALAERGRANFTPDEERRYEELRAAADFEAQRHQPRTIAAADLPGTAWDLVESRHTQKDVPLFVVKRTDHGDRLPCELFDDLNAKAKALRGRYSSYRKGRAIPGFVFYERDSAEKFLRVARGEADASNAEEVDASERFHAERRAQRLEERADAIAERAEDELSRDRRTNTRRRLEHARGAEAAARTELRVARSLEQIAERIKNGTAKYLGRIRTRTQLEALDDLLVAAKYRRPHDEPERGGPPRASDIPRVQYPWPTLSRSLLGDVVAAAERTPGAKQAGARLARLLRATPGERVVFASQRDLDLFELLAARLRGSIADRLRGELAPYKRLQAAGITTEALLREALREYLQCCRGPAPVPDPLRDAEREVALQAIPGFFPTPPGLADAVVAKAGLRPGMHVLEPSAGSGALAEAILRAEPDVQLDVIERNASLRDILAAKGFHLVNEDFLKFQPTARYDAIIQNPPFEADQDIEHVRHAYDLLAPGGVLVSIMSAGAFHPGESGRKLRREFRDWLDDVGGHWSENPDGAFLESARPTGVHTVTVRIQKPVTSARAEDSSEAPSSAGGDDAEPEDAMTLAAFASKGAGEGAAQPEQTVPLLERFGSQAAPAPPPPSPPRLEAERQAAVIFDRMAELLPARDGAVDPDALTAVRFALEDLEAVPVRHTSEDPESWGERDEAWYEQATWHYDREIVKPDELPAFLGVDWSPEMTADLLSSFIYESERFGGNVPDWLFRQQIADAIHPDPRYGRLELQVVPKEMAFAFVKEHHSTLGGGAKLPPGIQYALGAVRREAFQRPELVAVALAGHPTGRWSDLAGQPCGPREILELHRVASIGGLHTVNRRGERVPLNAASMLTSRIMDLLPRSARTDRAGCLLVTYSLVSERGTPYLALVSKGLRPVARIRGKAATGARAGSSGTALNAEDKIRWEYGPAASPPAWEVLQGVVDADRIHGAQVAFAAFSAAGVAREGLPELEPKARRAS